MHTGTHYICEVLGLDMGTQAAHIRREGAIESVQGYKVVMPLRHPALVAVTFKKRGWAERNGWSWLEQWQRLDDVQGFFFPIETKPFDDLEAYVGYSVDRIEQPVASLGNYPEKQSLDAAKSYLASEWADVEKALCTNVGSEYY